MSWGILFFGYFLNNLSTYTNVIDTNQFLLLKVLHIKLFLTLIFINLPLLHFLISYYSELILLPRILRQKWYGIFKLVKNYFFFFTLSIEIFNSEVAIILKLNNNSKDYVKVGKLSVSSYLAFFFLYYRWVHVEKKQNLHSAHELEKQDCYNLKV